MNPNSEQEPRLEPIPSPPGHLVREFCYHHLPILAFAAAVAVVAILWHERFYGADLSAGSAPTNVAEDEARPGSIASPPVAYVTGTLELGTSKPCDEHAAGEHRQDTGASR